VQNSALKKESNCWEGVEGKREGGRGRKEGRYFWGARSGWNKPSPGGCGWRTRTGGKGAWESEKGEKEQMLRNL